MTRTSREVIQVFCTQGLATCLCGRAPCASLPVRVPRWLSVCVCPSWPFGKPPHPHDLGTCYLVACSVVARYCSGRCAHSYLGSGLLGVCSRSAGRGCGSNAGVAGGWITQTPSSGDALFTNLGFLSGIIRQNWNDTEKISMAPAQG